MLGEVGYRECQQAAWMVADPDVVTFHVRFRARQFQAGVRDTHIGLRGVTDPFFDAVELAGMLVAAGQQIGSSVVGEEQLAGVKAGRRREGSTRRTAGVIRKRRRVAGVVGDAEVPTGDAAGSRNKQCPFDFGQRLYWSTTGVCQCSRGNPAAGREPARPPPGQCGEQREAFHLGQRGPLATRDNQAHPADSFSHLGCQAPRVNFSSEYRVVAAGGLQMSPLLMLYFWAGAPIVGFGLVKLQARLERWDYERHAED